MKHIVAQSFEKIIDIFVVDFERSCLLRQQSPPQSQQFLNQNL
jgi:hypothetical protein